MLKITGVKISLEEDESSLPQKTAKFLRISENHIREFRIFKKSIDARDGIFFVYSLLLSLDNEDAILKKHLSSVSLYTPNIYQIPAITRSHPLPPVVVGMGPAGLFAALILARSGLKPIVLERGQDAQTRKKDVEAFFTTGILNEQSNVQFGEGGAGAFSDGKLNTLTKDDRHRFILETMVSCGAPASILYDAKPHIGTDMLHVMIQNIRKELQSLGADIRFGSQLVGVHHEGGQLTSIDVQAKDSIYSLPCSHVVLALGHSARDTIEMLYASGIAMEQKPFAVGVRIEHLQKSMDVQQYKEYAGNPSLPPTSYKLSCHLENGRSAFSFCVCPGGQVVAAASEQGRLVTNGMSEYARDQENINGGLLINVTPEDFGSSHPLAGIAFQRKYEQAAFEQGESSFRAPCQRVEDFLNKIPSTSCGHVRPSYRPGVVYTNLWDCLPPFVAQSIALALPKLNQILPGYADGDALLTAIESRSSSPVRVPRDIAYQCNIRGIFPCGEGAGYAGGILSAAADGMRCAEKIL